MAVKSAKTTPAGHAAGIFADMSLDGPEIGTLVAVVDRARNLPNRKTMGKQDPYCAMRLGKFAKKTETDRRGGQTPRWDQELRFTVHDSPDYYKLKCSIFNDDKKTDLIGEAWLDLTEVIVPGGGQNDLWHQLNYKGKYAGDIRMEMTYYDTRVHPEPPSDKRKQREKASSGYSDGVSPGSGSHQLGPREIKRRPLPPGPGLPELNDMPAPLHFQPRPSQQPPQPQTNAHRQHPHHQHPRWMFETPDEFGNGHPPYVQHDQYQRQNEYHDECHGPESTQNDYQEQEYFNQPGDTFMPLYDSLAAQHTTYPTGYNGMTYFGSPHSHPSSPYTPHHSSPPVRQSPPAGPLDSYRDNRLSQSPTKYVPFRDSPLRQSLSQQEVPLSPAAFDPRFDEDDAPPPPPPTHRGSLPRPGGPTAFNTPPQNRQTRQTRPSQSIVDERSPLQMLEQQFNPHAPHAASGRRLSHLSQQDHVQDRPTPILPGAETGAAGEFPAPHQLTMNYGVDFMTNPVETDREGKYVRRNSAVESQDFQLLAQRSQTFEDVFDEHNTYRSEPQVVRPRAVSPNAVQTVARKSVSPLSYSPNDRARMSGIPFGPDSYDALNPGSSPASHGHTTPEHGREAARQQEVNKLRDQGPIIGNDGRVIDPSDHLPSDTWAPEPERKNRKPEHVIHVRRKNEPQPRSESLPAPIRPRSHTNSPYSSSPAAMMPVSPPEPPYHPPPDPASAPNSGRRNRLQKQMPQRPLPTQPFAHPHSSPGAIPQARTSNQPSPNQKRHSVSSSPMSGLPPRPLLSEYQVPVSSDRYPRNSYHPQETPTRMALMPLMPQQPQNFAYGGHDDSLAAEMSMIDIGPARGGGRTMLRSNRGYGGY